MNIIEEDVVKFTNLNNGDVFKLGGKVYIKMQNVDIPVKGNINCVNLKTGDYSYIDTDTVIQKFENAELHLR